MTVSRLEHKQRLTTRRYLYTIAARYVGTSPEINYWMLPDVLEWELNEETGLYTVPASVFFYVDPTVFWDIDRRHQFEKHLAQATGFRFGRGSFWEVDYENLHHGFIVALHLSQAMTITSPDGYHSQTIYLPSSSYVPNSRYVGLLRRIWRGLFRDSWNG